MPKICRVRKKRFVVALLLVSQFMFGQGKSGILHPEKKQDAIPFVLTDHNNISVKAVLNKQDTVKLMFHTAASSITLTEEATAKITSLRYGRTDSVKSWGGNDNTSRYSESNILQMGEMQWETMPIWENKYSGPGTDGKFGTDLFKGKVIEIDYDNKLIRLHQNLPGKSKAYEKLKLLSENDMLFLEASLQTSRGVFKNKFLIHSGYSGTLLLDDNFVAQNKIDQILKVVDEKELKDSFGNIIKTKKAILPAFIIGSEKLSSVPVGFFSGAIGRQKMSIIGGDLLKRFNIIIDVEREFIYLKSNKAGQGNFNNS